MKKNTKEPLIILFLLLSSTLLQSEPTWQNLQDNLGYIQKYKDIAVREMHRTGIPASIKLAQGILESAAGKSELAQKANNHFGIKCGGDWKGDTFKKKDDDFKNGVRIESCFRVYKNPEESFVAHSNFLTNPSKKSRYGFLFDYKKTDYKKWAKGLKKAGYATNPKYPKLLINLIEDYEFHQFDKIELDELEKTDENLPVTPVIIADNQDANSEIEGDPVRPPVSDKPIQRPSNEPTKAKEKEKEKEKPKENPLRKPPQKPTKTSEYGTFSINSVEAVLVQKGDTPQSLAKRYKIKMSKIVKYNELQPPYDLKEGTYIYLQPKRNIYQGKENYHIVKNNETMHDISQRYGLRLSRILKRNQIEAGQEPLNEERIILRGKRFSPPKLRTELVAQQDDKKEKVDSKATKPAAEDKPTDEKPLAKAKTFCKKIIGRTQNR